MRAVQIIYHNNIYKYYIILNNKIIVMKFAQTLFMLAAVLMAVSTHSLFCKTKNDVNDIVAIAH